MPKKVVQRIEGMMYRTIDLRKHGVINEENRTVHISISSETPVLKQTFFSAPWLEVLGHKRGEVNLDRLNDGAPVLFNHDNFSRANRIGVVESATIRDRRIEAVIRFSKRDDVNDIWQDIQDGILRNISVGYTVNERTLTRENKGAPNEFRITDWTPFEVSAVSTPADSTIGIGRGFEDGETALRHLELREASDCWAAHLARPQVHEFPTESATALWFVPVPRSNRTLWSLQRREETQCLP